jgi:hypothetical protein
MTKQHDIQQLTKNLLMVINLEMEHDHRGNFQLNRKDSGNEILAAMDELEEALAQPEREWGGLTVDEYHTIRNSTWEVSEAIRFTEAKLKEKNT